MEINFCFVKEIMLAGNFSRNIISRYHQCQGNHDELHLRPSLYESIAPLSNNAVACSAMEKIFRHEKLSSMTREFLSYRGYIVE